MNAIEKWPVLDVQATVPLAAQLSPTYDPDALCADLVNLTSESWHLPRVAGGGGIGAVATQEDWRALPLRSIGGRVTRSDPGGPDDAEFADTELLQSTPYIRGLLADLPASVMAARLMALGPGAQSPLHCDTKTSFPWGLIRLHVPIVVPAGATLLLGEEHVWEPGTLWYADFSHPHAVRNTGTQRRIHLVIDVRPSPEMWHWFPDEFQRESVRASVLYDQPVIEDGSAAPITVSNRIDIPLGFFDTDTFGDDAFTGPFTRVHMHQDGSTPALSCADGTTYQLVRLKGGDFRFAGWTMERTISLRRDGSVELVVRDATSQAQTQLQPVPA